MKKTTRSLGKVSSRLLTTLASQDKSIFTIADALKVTKTSALATRRLISDLVKKKWLIRLVPGKYLIVPLSAGEEGEYSENWYVIAKNLIAPAPYYFSHYSALDIHEMTEHPLVTIYVSTPKRKSLKKILGARFRFIYIQPKNIWGIEEIWITPTQKVKVSDLERTIIDCLDRSELAGGISEIAKGIWTKRNSIDWSKLLSYVKKSGRKGITKRLGFILETYHLSDDKTLEALKEMVTPSYQLLDSSLPASGRFLNTWRLRINIEPEELISITKT